MIAPKSKKSPSVNKLPPCVNKLSPSVNKFTPNVNKLPQSVNQLAVIPFPANSLFLSFYSLPELGEPQPQKQSTTVALYEMFMHLKSIEVQK